jgi:hypothetical protein
MTSGQDVSEYLDTFGLVKSYFFKFFEGKKIQKKKMSWCSDAPEDQAISLFEGLLANPDITLNPVTSRSHIQPSHSQTSHLLTSSPTSCVPVPHTTQCMRDM